MCWSFVGFFLFCKNEDQIDCEVKVVFYYFNVSVYYYIDIILYIICIKIWKKIYVDFFKIFQLICVKLVNVVCLFQGIWGMFVVKQIIFKIGLFLFGVKYLKLFL